MIQGLIDEIWNTSDESGDGEKLSKGNTIKYPYTTRSEPHKLLVATAVDKRARLGLSEPNISEASHALLRHTRMSQL